MRYDVISFDLIRACLAIPVGSGLYSASFGRSTEPRKRVSAHAETIPIAQHHCPPWVAAGLIGHPAQLGGKRPVGCGDSRLRKRTPVQLASAGS